MMKPQPGQAELTAIRVHIASCRRVLAALEEHVCRLEADRPRTEVVRPQPETQGLADLLQRFLDWMRIRNYSPATIRNRRGPLRRFLRWCKGASIILPTEVTSETLEHYQVRVHEMRRRNGRSITPSTQHFLLEPVRAFFNWLSKGNFVPENPASGLTLPRLGKTLPRDILTPAEADQIMSQPDVNTPLGIRDRAILETLYSSGIRRAELCALAVTDIDAGRRTLTVREGKGRRDRVVPIGRRALGWIVRYMKSARPCLARGEDAGALFLTATRGCSLAQNTLSRLAKAYRDSAGIAKRGSCHVFRHTMATLMLENGADLRSLQEILGHACLQTTERYTHVSIRRLTEVHARAHPAERSRR